MILSGNQIVAAREQGDIVIEPFVAEHVNPNSYNFRLGETLREYRSETLDPRAENDFVERTIGPEGFVLEPGRLYLAHTIERLGGTVYAPTFAARSSIARLGLFINLSAPLGDIGFVGQWTLQLYCAQPLRVYAGMPIGQMMWWKAVGDVELYHGKYQGSAGPRTSDIHLDFLAAEGRALLPRLGSDADVTDVGPKFATLSRLSRDFPVPDAFAVPASFLRDGFEDGAAAEIDRLMQDTRATVGAFLTETLTRIGALAAGLRLADRQRRLLRHRTEAFLKKNPGATVAVRSSGLAEDGVTTSLAGTHRSVLGVSTADEVIDAVEEAYRSWYEPPAVLSRVRAGDYASTPQLALFVQRMIDPERAGVAFTSPVAGQAEPRVLLTYVRGLADRLVGGADEGVTVDSADGELPEGLDEVVARVRAVRQAEGHDVDVEWAVDADGFHLLQARPVTAALDDADLGPHVAVAALYDGPISADVRLGEVAPIYASYEAKRGPAHRLARSLGFRTGRGIVASFNAAGLADPALAAPLHEFVAGTGAAEFVVDFSEHVRQVICSRDDVIGTLTDRVAAVPAHQLGHAVVREFIRGRAGVITTGTESGVLAEVAEGGLLALNRGTAGAGQVLVEASVVKPLDEVPAEALTALENSREALLAMTAAMAEQHGATTLEWVLQDARLYFTDYSKPAGPQVSVGDGLVMSAGTASGPVLDLRDRNDLLERLSVGPAVSIERSLDVTGYGPITELLDQIAAAEQPPIVRAAFPYAVLSVLLDRVAGFVFDRGSALCHLAILLREARIPAVVTDGPLPDRIVIADGKVVGA